MDKSTDIFSKKSQHMQDEDTDYGTKVVKIVVGDPPCKDTRTGSSHKSLVAPKCLRSKSVPGTGLGGQKQQVNDQFSRTFSDSNLQAQQPNGVRIGRSHGRCVGHDGGADQELSKGSYAVTTFVANKLYAGLKHPTHRKKFRKIVTELMKATKSKDEDGDSDSETAPLVAESSSPQVQNGAVHVAINMDEMTSLNADSASDDSRHVEETKN